MELQVIPIKKSEKSQDVAPTTQFMVDENNITQIMEKFYIKKKDIPDPRIIGELKNLCTNAEYKRDPIKMLALFEARKEILENAGEIYALKSEVSLFEQTVKELEALMAIIEQHTFQK